MKLQQAPECVLLQSYLKFLSGSNNKIQADDVFIICEAKSS